jgi:succinate dehydrogenase / fumarate reductase flavoprotein subunit
LFAKDVHRNESCGGHFREEYQSEDGEAQRDDENFAYVAAGSTLKPSEAVLHKNHWCMKMLN